MRMKNFEITLIHRSDGRNYERWTTLDASINSLVSKEFADLDRWRDRERNYSRLLFPKNLHGW